MRKCEDMHRAYDRLANADVNAGELPSFLRVRGKVAWYVHQGSYEGLGRAFQVFMEKAMAAYPGQVTGPPGDVYVCDPDDHRGAGVSTLTTIFWTPMTD